MYLEKTGMKPGSRLLWGIQYIEINLQYGWGIQYTEINLQYGQAGWDNLDVSHFPGHRKVSWRILVKMQILILHV